jgi:hypothetical protein
MGNLTICNNCAGTIVLSLCEHTAKKGLYFCSGECAEHFFSDDNDDKTPIGLLYDLGCE